MFIVVYSLMCILGRMSLFFFFIKRLAIYFL